jgi:hypothetical protein
MVDLPWHLRWFADMLGTDDVRAVRLVASDETLRERVERREIGTGGDEQLVRTYRYAAAIRAEAAHPAVTVIETDGRLPADIAADIVGYSGWA